MRDVAARKVRVVEVETPSPSPFARSLLFGYVGMFLYEADAPLAERRAAALSLDSTLLAELLGSEAIRELLDPEVVAEVERSLQRLAPDRHARDAEGAADLLRFLGPLSTAEAAARGVAPEWLAELEAARRVIRVRIAGEERWIAIEDAGRVRDALGVPLPVGVPEAFTEPVPDPLGDLLLAVRPHARPVPGGRGGGAVRARGGRGRPACWTGWSATGRLVRGELRPAALATGPARAPSTATPRCCGGCGGPRWPGCGRRSSRSSSGRWAGSCRRGRACRSRPAAGAGGCAARRAWTTSWAWSSSWPGRRCRRARWSR